MFGHIGNDEKWLFIVKVFTANHMIIKVFDLIYNTLFR